MEFANVTQSELEAIIQEIDLSRSRLIRKALQQARKTHGNQTRDSGEPVLDQHIYPVTKLVIEHQLMTDRRVTPQLVAAALLHDVLDDDPNFQNIEGGVDTPRFSAEFGYRVYNLIFPLIDAQYLCSRNERIKKSLNYLALYGPNQSRIIKLADWYANFCCMSTPPFVENGRPTRSFLERFSEAEDVLIFAKRFPFFIERIRAKLIEYTTQYGLHTSVSFR